ncbi:MAG: glycosyltransferase family 39 protein [Ignavibacteria bacterium]|nr:glycosyltransferase family 39 protein [Ignavibacteria bacterium]
MKSNSPFKLNILLILLFSMFTMFMLASGYFSIGFLSDDYLNIISANTSTLSEKFTGDVPYYSKNHLRPIWFLSIQTTHAITNSLGFANDNFLLYRIENLLLIFCFTFVASHLIYRITGKVAASILLAGLILSFPNNLNSICWTIGKVDLMAGIFILASIYYSAKFSQGTSKVWLLISVAMLALGLLTKETAVITPFVCYLILKYSSTGEEGNRKQLLLNQSVIVVLYLLFRIFLASGNFTEAITTYSDSTLTGRLIVALQAFISLLFPFDYLSLQNDFLHFDLLLILYIVIIILLSVSLVHAIWKKKLSGLLLSSILIFFISIIPNLAAGYFRPQLILIPFSLTVISLIVFISKSEVKFRITGGILAVVIIYWLLIDYQLIRNWNYASMKSRRSNKRTPEFS